MNDSQIQIQAYSYFLTEAPELLQSIEHEILTLPNEHTTAKVHVLMRSLHTLKGAAANVGLATIELIAHQFEDVARVFYDLELEIDVSIQTLLLDGYSALDECLNAQIMDREIDEVGILDRMQDTLGQLKVKLGDWTEADIALPTAMELGFDIVASIFETTIQEQIDEISAVILTENIQQIVECLERVTDICISLAESFELPGFLAINQAIIMAMSHHPDLINEIASISLANIRQAQADVLAGDRISGGNISAELIKLAENSENSTVERSLPQPNLAEVQLEKVILQINPVEEIEIIASGATELAGFQAFLISDRFSKRHEFSTDNQHLFTQIVRLCWDWFRHEIQPPQSQLNLEILVTVEGLGDLDYIHHWIGLILQGLKTGNDRSSLQLYRECCIYQVVYAVAKYLADSTSQPQITADLLTQLRSRLQTTVNAYKQEIPVTANERGWIDRIIIPHHWTAISAIAMEEDLLLSEVWGQLDLGKDRG
jgi:two-component system, chemotaxis family, sensor histidine kinase and response regulator PixL